MEDQGILVLKLRTLLLDILQNPTALRRVLYLSCAACLHPSLANIILDNYSVAEIVDLLLSGVTAAELSDRTGRRLGVSSVREDLFLMEPIPNAYFMRDPAAIIGTGLVSCKMHFLARVRESILVREIFRRHPLLKHNQILYGAVSAEDRPFTVEGGDVIVLSDKAVAIGVSQRTRSETIAAIATQLFQAGSAQRVYEITIPGERAYMHLDTVFTVVDEGLVVAYPDVMGDVKEVRRYEPLVIPGGQIVALPVEENRPFNTILEHEFGHLTVVHTGNNSRRYAAREQQADGTNVFAIRPGVVITYDRNVHTNAALRAEGVTVLEIEGSELVRGLGGPRCMTLPLRRETRKEPDNESN